MINAVFSASSGKGHIVTAAPCEAKPEYSPFEL
jgi:hypothetical protein